MSRHGAPYFLFANGFATSRAHSMLIKIGAKVVSHGRYVAFQMAEVAIRRQMFQEILWRRRSAPRPTIAEKPEEREHSHHVGVHLGNPG